MYMVDWCLNKGSHTNLSDQHYRLTPGPELLAGFAPLQAQPMAGHSMRLRSSKISSELPLDEVDFRCDMLKMLAPSAPS